MKTNITIKKNKGFTLIELVVTISVAAILTSIAIPGFSTMLNNNKMATTGNEILAGLNFTRSTAITQGSPATLCKSNAQSTDCDNSANWQDGWIVFNDKNNNGSVDALNDEIVLMVHQGKGNGLNISYGHNKIVYNNEGFSIGYAGIFLLCDARGDSAKKGIIISSNGRPRKAETDEITANCPTTP